MKTQLKSAIKLLDTTKDELQELEADLQARLEELEKKENPGDEIEEQECKITAVQQAISYIDDAMGELNSEIFQ